MSPEQAYRRGVLYCVLAHFFWGGMAGYFGLLRHVLPQEIAIHRAIWALPIAFLIVWLSGQLGEAMALLRQPRTLLILGFTGALVALNWAFYIWAIEQGRTLEASLGYFVNPLMNVVVGFLFLGERFRPAQVIAIGFACLGVAVQTWSTGAVPWLGLLLAAMFCLYGLIRKSVAAGPSTGFLIEVALLTPPGLVLLAFMELGGVAQFFASPLTAVMLMGCGLLTAAALLLFGHAIKLIPYSTAGLLQYISPSLVFLTAVFVFHEPVDAWKLVSFALVWLALVVFTLGGPKAGAAAALAKEEGPMQ